MSKLFFQACCAAALYALLKLASQMCCRCADQHLLEASVLVCLQAVLLAVLSQILLSFEHAQQAAFAALSCLLRAVPAAPRLCAQQ